MTRSNDRTDVANGAGLTVAFVNANRKWGGVKTWTLDFGEALRHRGHRVTAIVRSGTPFEDACRQKGFTVHPFSFGPKYNPWAIARLVGLLRREGPDVVVVNISKDLEIGAVAARLCGIPVVHRVGLVEDYKGSREERLRHRLLVDRILVPSEYLKEGLLARFAWLRPDEIAVIPNSKRLECHPRPAPRAGRDVVFGVTSQLSESKGHALLLRALDALGSRGLAVRLRIAGVGPLEEALRRQVQDLGLTGVVEFCGFQRDIPAFLAELDAYVLPSLKESFSNAVLEAMWSALPVVAFASGGVPEVVGEGGVLVPAGDVPALAQAMERVATDAALREALGSAARARAAERFDLDKNAARLEEFLREVSRS